MPMKAKTQEKVIMVEVDCDIVAGEWDEDTDWDGIAERAIAAALQGAGYERLLEDECVVEISVRLTDDEEVQRLNRDYRGKDKPTNILSFPMQQPESLPALLASADMDLLLGDLAVALETVEREAADKQIALQDHVSHLLVHGTLHLLGHDHADDKSADEMEALEVRILAGMGIINPYERVCEDIGAGDRAS